MGLTIGVLGASGGVGASTLTAALAVRAPAVIDDCHLSIALDLDPRGGLDTILCIEHLDGPRWPDLERADWTEPGQGGRVGRAGGLARDLPGESGVRVIAGTGDAVPGWSVVAETLEWAGEEADLVAVDCGPRPPDSLLSRLDLLVVMARLTPKGATDAAGVTRLCQLARTRTVLVTRGSSRQRGAAALARELDLPFLAHLPDDRELPRQAREGLAPGAARSVIVPIADELLTVAEADWLAALFGRLDGSGRTA